MHTHCRYSILLLKAIFSPLQVRALHFQASSNGFTSSLVSQQKHYCRGYLFAADADDNIFFVLGAFLLMLMIRINMDSGYRLS